MLRLSLFPLERLSPSRPAQTHDHPGRGIHPALPAPHAAARFPAHPPLRPAGGAHRAILASVSAMWRAASPTHPARLSLAGPAAGLLMRALHPTPLPRGAAIPAGRPMRVSVRARPSQTAVPRMPDAPPSLLPVGLYRARTDRSCCSGWLHPTHRLRRCGHWPHTIPIATQHSAVWFTARFPRLAAPKALSTPALLRRQPKEPFAVTSPPDFYLPPFQTLPACSPSDPAPLGALWTIWALSPAVRAASGRTQAGG